MSYFALYLGICLGYLLKILPSFGKDHREIKIFKTIQRARRFIVDKILQIRRAFKRFWLFLKYTEKAFRQKLLANPFFYICAKTASIYQQKGGRVKLCFCNSVLEFCQRNGYVFTIIEPSQKRPVCIPEFFEKTEQETLFFDSPAIYIAELSNARVCGGSSILLCHNQCLYDPIASDIEERLDIKFSNLVGKIGKKLIIELTPSSYQIEAGIFMMGFASYNYYHLTVEILSRLKYIDSLHQYDQLPLLVDEIMIQVPQYQQLLNACNYSGRQIIPISHNSLADVKRLIFPSYNTWMPINVKERNSIRPGDFLIAKSALTNIRSSTIFPRKEPFRKIFLSRKNLSAARLDNEGEIAECFQKYGFEIVCPENMTWAEQVSLFQQAKCIAGASGAALTNIIYCQPQIEVICIIPQEYNFYMYSSIAYLLELKIVFLDASITQRTPYPASDLFHLDLEYCRRFLQKYTDKSSIE